VGCEQFSRRRQQRDNRAGRSSFEPARHGAGNDFSSGRRVYSLTHDLRRIAGPSSHGIIACRNFCFSASVQFIATALVPVDLYVIIFAVSSTPEYSVHFYAVDLIAATVLPVESYLVIFRPS
jgi:hypothetical protein